MVNVERAPQIGPVFAHDGVPTIYGFHGGSPVWRQLGSPDPTTLAQMYEGLAGLAGGPTWSGTPG